LIDQGFSDSFTATGDGNHFISKKILHGGNYLLQTYLKKSTFEKGPIGLQPIC
jgi:hypothetical protein